MGIRVPAERPVLVTGASSGIGREIAESLSKSGYLVYATVRREKDAASLRRFPDVHPIIMDVTKLEQVKRGIAEIRRAGKGLYGVVNNAGMIDYWPLVELEDGELRRSFEVNLFGVQRVVREALPLLVESGGRVVNISSLSGLVSTRYSGPYEMTKHALEAYSETLRKELKDYGVAVAIIEPGGFRSNYAKTTAKLLAKRAKSRRPAVMKKEVGAIAKEWREWVLEVEREPSPSLVAVAVREALSSKEPKHRYVVAANAKEFRWALGRLMSKLVEVNRGSGYSLSKKDVQKLLDDTWDRRR